MKFMKKEIIPATLMALLVVLLVGCFNPVGPAPGGKTPVTPSNPVKKSSIKVSLVLPAYKMKAGASRVIDPRTANVALKVNGTLHQNLAIGTGTTAYDSTVAQTWTGTFTGIGIGTYAPGTLVIELRDASNAVLTSGNNTSAVTVSETATPSVSIYCLPVTSTVLTVGDAAASGSVAEGSMVYYRFTPNTTYSNTITLTSDTGDADLYLFNQNGTPVASNTGLTSPSEITHNFGTNQTVFIGVYGFSAATYSLSIANASLAAPSGFEASLAVYDAKICLYWTAGITGATFNVHRSTAIDGTYTDLTSGSPISQNTYTDTTVAANTTYYYKVTTTYGGVTSDYSSAAIGSTATPVFLDGTISASTNIIWYSFPATAGKEYFIQWGDDYDGPAAYTGDIYLQAFHQDGVTSFFYQADSGYTTPKTITPTTNETVYLKISPYGSGTYGPFGVRVYSRTQVIPVTAETGSAAVSIY